VIRQERFCKVKLELAFEEQIKKNIKDTKCNLGQIYKELLFFFFLSYSIGNLDFYFEGNVYFSTVFGFVIIISET
jgi:hypothetical protein